MSDFAPKSRDIGPGTVDAGYSVLEIIRNFAAVFG
jgi:hypothetical protein